MWPKMAYKIVMIGGREFLNTGDYLIPIDEIHSIDLNYIGNVDTDIETEVCIVAHDSRSEFTFSGQNAIDLREFCTNLPEKEK